MESLAGIVEIVRELVVWFLRKRDRNRERAQNIADAERKLDDAVDRGNTIGELSEAVENLRRQHEAK